MTRLSRSVLIVLLVLTLAPLQLHALSVIEVSDEQLAEKAEMIVLGRVLSAYSEKVGSTGDIFTYVSVRISEQLKGKANHPDLVLKIAGGRVGDEIVSFPGAADFYRNEEVLLFLERRSDKSLMPIGMMLGKYSVYRDSESGKRIVYRHTDGNGRYFPSARPDTVTVDRESKLYLTDFCEKIRKIVKQGRER
jgi:hypothetical protein